MKFRFQPKPYYDPVSKTTKCTIISDESKDFFMFSTEIDGDLSNKSEDELINETLDKLFKTVFVDKAIPEAIQKVDKLQSAIEQSGKEREITTMALIELTEQVFKLAESIGMIPEGDVPADTTEGGE